MDRVVIVVSDLHLGKSDELEHFVPENENAFCRFLEHLQSKKFRNKEIVHLVVLGDFLDIWRIATKTEKHATGSDQIDISINEGLDIERVKEIVAAHPHTFNALRDFLDANPDRRIVCTPGNHDHSLVQPGVRDVVAKAIAQGKASRQKRIDFKNWYENPEFGIYAEHGNRFDEDNDYDNFALFGAEAPGYFFVRLFLNRLEIIEPNLNLDIWTNVFSDIWRQGPLEAISTANRLFHQYVRDERPFKRIRWAMRLPFVLLKGRAVGVPSRRENLREFPDLLFSEMIDPERIFSTNNELERKLRTLYHKKENVEFREAVDEILHEKSPRERIRVPKPSAERPHSKFLIGDSYVSAVRGMYNAPNGTPYARALKGRFLNPERHKYVLLGHTHVEKKETLRDLKVTYFNTGSWSVHRDTNAKNTSRLCYVIFEKNSSGVVTGTQQLWKL